MRLRYYNDGNVAKSVNVDSLDTRHWKLGHTHTTRARFELPNVTLVTLCRWLLCFRLKISIRQGG